jgi:hypothetical protein
VQESGDWLQPGEAPVVAEGSEVGVGGRQAKNGVEVRGIKMEERRERKAYIPLARACASHHQHFCAAAVGAGKVGYGRMWAAVGACSSTLVVCSVYCMYVLYVASVIRMTCRLVGCIIVHVCIHVLRYPVSCILLIVCISRALVYAYLSA